MRRSTLFRFGVVVLSVGVWIGCANENEPRYWAKKVGEPAYREIAIKKLGELYNTALEKAKNNPEDPAVVDVKNKVVPVLLEAFNKYRTDNINRGNILAILAQIGDPRAVPAFEELLDYQEGINETDASKAADALGVLASDQSIPKIIAMMKKAQLSRIQRGQGSRNRPEEDWIARSGIESLNKILRAKPDTQYKGDAVDVLVKVLETTADEQDFFLNMKAAVALGDSGDPRAIGILVRGLFMQGRGATIYQQCRVALTKIAISHRAEVLDMLLKAYKGEFKELEEDAVKYQFIPGVKEDKIGRIFAELRVTEQAVLDEMMKKLGNPDPGISGFTAISLGLLEHGPALDRMVAMAQDKAVQTGVVPGLIEAFEYYQDPGKTAEILFKMVTDKEKWDKTFRLRAALALTRIAGGDYLQKYQAAVAQETEEDVRKEMVGFTERLEVAKECGESVDCWLGKLEGEQWRAQEKALFTLVRLAGAIPQDRYDAVSSLMKSGNQDVIKVLFILLDKLYAKGCSPGKICDRLLKIIPYWRAKPQSKVRANDAECLLARLIQRQGGSLKDMAATSE